MLVIVMKESLDKRPYYYSKDLNITDDIMKATKFKGDDFVVNYYLNKIRKKYKDYKSWVVAIPDVLFYNDNNIITELTNNEEKELSIQLIS